MLRPLTVVFIRDNQEISTLHLRIYRQYFILFLSILFIVLFIFFIWGYFYQLSQMETYRFKVLQLQNQIYRLQTMVSQLDNSQTASRSGENVKPVNLPKKVSAILSSTANLNVIRIENFHAKYSADSSELRVTFQMNKINTDTSTLAGFVIMQLVHTDLLRRGPIFPTTALRDNGELNFSNGDAFSIRRLKNVKTLFYTSSEPYNAVKLWIYSVKGILLFENLFYVEDGEN